MSARRTGEPPGVRGLRVALRTLRTLHTELSLRQDGGVVLWLGDLPKNRATGRRRAAQEALRERLLLDLVTWFDVGPVELHRVARPFRRPRAKAHVEPDAPRDAPPLAEDLAALGLGALPKSRAELRRAWSAVARTTHPDHGGSHAAFVAARAAYERVARRFESTTPP